MATIIGPEIKQKLIDMGLRRDFVKEHDSEVRNCAIRGETANVADINRKILNKIAPELVEEVKDVGRPKKKSAGKGVAKNVGKGEEKSEKVVESAKSCGGGAVGGVVGVIDDGDDDFDNVDPSVFANKNCSLGVSFMWAYSHLCMRGVRPKDAPSAVAWQMYLDMKKSPSMKSDMLKSGLGAAMRKAEAEENVGTKFDGEGEYDVLSVIACGGMA